MTIDPTHLIDVGVDDDPSVAFINGVQAAINNLKDNAADNSTSMLESSVGAVTAGDRGLKFWLTATTWVRLLWDNGASAFKLLNQAGTPLHLVVADATDNAHAATKGQLDDAISTLSDLVTAAIASLVTVPTGAILEWPTASLPAGGYLWANGQAVSRSTYAALFALYGTTYGAGDGSTTFNLPDRRQRVAIGTGTMGGASNPSRITSASDGGGNANALGGAGGAETHTLITGELPNHSLSLPLRTDGGGGSSSFVRGATSGGTSVGTALTSSIGSDLAHSNTQPWIALNFIIKT